MSDIKRLLGKKIKNYRELRGYTQEFLAEKADINTRSLSFIECGTNFVTAATLDKLCKTLEVTPKQLFDFDYCAKQSDDLKAEINDLLNSNPEKLNDVFKILNGFLS